MNESVLILGAIVGALGGLWALADRLRNRGQTDSRTVMDGMSKLASELRTELDRKGEEFVRELHAERKECDERIKRVREDLQEVKNRLTTVEDANGL